MMIRQFFSAIFCLPVLCFANTAFDPAAGEVALTVNQATARQQSVTQGQSPDGQTMLHVQWDCAKANYLEFAFHKPAVLQEFKEGDFELALFIPEQNLVRKISLRITDAQGETLQYQLTGNRVNTGRHTINYRLKAVNPNSWGKDKNGKIDFPAKITGFSVDFNAKEGNGELWIGKADFTPAPLDAGELIVDPAETEINLSQGAERKQSAEVKEFDGKKARNASWNSAGARWFEFSFRPAPAPIEQFESARFDIELYKPENFTARRINIRLTDKSGETFQFALPIDELKTGWNLVSRRVDVNAGGNAGVWGGDGNKTFDFPIRVTGFSVDYPADSGDGNVGIGRVFFSK